MPQITLMVRGKSFEEAAAAAIAQVMHALQPSLLPDLDLENLVKEAYTILSIEARDKETYRVILYGTFKDIAMVRKELR